MSPQTQQAIIYCRVSSTKQVREGHGLVSQETRCREHARYRDYDVLETFADDVTGSISNRRGINAMLVYLRQRRASGLIVLFDDLSRLGRDRDAYWGLREKIEKAGGIPESPSFKFGKDADSILVEGLMVEVHQHARLKDAEQTKNRMRARAQNGYAVSQAPVGYKYERVTGRGQMLKRREPQASIIIEALEGYASGRFEIQSDVMRFLNEHPLFPRGASGVLGGQRVAQILTNPIYAGYIHVPSWDVSLRPAQHEPLISFATFRQIQDRLAGIGRAVYRKNLNEDFPLRGIVACDECHHPLTGYWATGSHNRFAYYQCHTGGCALYGKSIRRANIEGEFEAILKSAQPTESVVAVFRAIFDDVWAQRGALAIEHAKQLGGELLKLDRQVSQFLERIISTDVPSVIAAYEEKVKKLEADKLLIKERIANMARPAKSYDQAISTAMAFLSSLYNLWKSGSLEARRMVLKMAFADQLRYRRGEGFRTANLAFAFQSVRPDFRG